jgi:uncharacterized protein (DUF433 family)
MDSCAMKKSFMWVDPERMGGTPCFRGTRVPVSTLFDYLEAGDSLDDFLENFPSVKRAQVLAAIKEAGRELVRCRDLPKAA